MIYNKYNMSDDFDKKALTLGAKLYEDKKVTITGFTPVYLEEIATIDYEIQAIVKESEHKVYSVKFTIHNGCIMGERCGCIQNESRYISYWDLSRRRCRHIAAAIYASMDYVQDHPECVPTNLSVSHMIASYQRESLAKMLVEQEEKIVLQPILEKEKSRYQVSFKIGSSKKYVLKNLYEFAEHMKTGATFSYGKDLKIIHHMDMFSELSQKLVTFILGKVAEMNTMLEEIDYYRYAKKPQKRHITLTPSILDEFFEIMVGQTITLIDKEAETKKDGTRQVQLLQGNPKIPVNIERFSPATFFNPTDKRTSKEFAGINVTTSIDGFIKGKQSAYVLLGDTLYQSDAQYKYAMANFLSTVCNQENGCYIGTDMMAPFYQQVIDQVRNYIQLNEYDAEEITSNLPPEPEFEFYLDTLGDDVCCETKVRYGQKLFNLYDRSEEHRVICNESEEFKVRLSSKHYLPYYDEERGISLCNKEEDVIYELLEEGIRALMEYGQVFVSDALQRMKVKTSPKISVGVSVNHNLLDLSIDTKEFNLNEFKDILASYRMKRRFHRLKNGDFLKLEENSLTALSEMMDSMHLSVKDLAKGKMQIPSYRALYLDKVLQDCEGIHYERDKNMKAMLRNFKAVEENDFDIPAELESVLRPYQKVGYQWLRTVEQYRLGGILADDMGLGKTLQVIAVLLAAKIEGKKGTSLIVCPASLIYNWENECKQFAPSLCTKVVAGTIEERMELIKNIDEVDVLITSYDLLKRDIDQYESVTFNYQIIDEAQYIKNHTTQGAKAVKIIKARTRYALTGTPIENRLSELWSIFDYLMPGFLYRYEQFKKEMEIPITKRVADDVMERLKRMVSPFILRRLKKDVLKDLPDKLEQITYSKMGTEQRLVYDAYLAKVRGDLASKNQDEFASSKLQILAELTRLRQICCDPSLIYDNYNDDSAKLSTCMELLANAVDSNHKVLLFSQFTSMLSIIENKLQQENISYYKITGATKKEERIRLVNQFNEDDTTVFLISLKAGGTGLNLTGADIVIHYDPWWNIAAQNQATDRAHRIGQKNVVTVFKLIMQDTIEEKIVKMQLSKKDLADQIISEDANQLQSMTKEDFEELLR